jgi:20S proteasome alpha/beta subunit
LTCIIGAKCAEGVVIAADTRILRETEASNEFKILPLWDRVAVAGAGTTALFDTLVKELEQKNTMPSAKSSLEAIKVVEDVIYELGKRYRPRLDSKDFDLDVLVAGLEGFDKGAPYLKAIDDRGLSEDVRRFSIIGHGRESAIPIFRMLYDQMLTLRELAILEAFVISLIVSLEIDQTVGFSGIGPQIIALRDDSTIEHLNFYDRDFNNVRELTEVVSEHPTAACYLVEPLWGKVPQAYETIVPATGFRYTRRTVGT